MVGSLAHGPVRLRSGVVDVLSRSITHLHFPPPPWVVPLDDAASELRRMPRGMARRTAAWTPRTSVGPWSCAVGFSKGMIKLPSAGFRNGKRSRMRVPRAGFQRRAPCALPRERRPLACQHRIHSAAHHRDWERCRRDCMSPIHGRYRHRD